MILWSRQSKRLPSNKQHMSFSCRMWSPYGAAGARHAPAQFRAGGTVALTFGAARKNDLNRGDAKSLACTYEI